MCFDRIEMISREYGKIECAPILNNPFIPDISFDREKPGGEVELFGASGTYGSIVHREVRNENYSLWHSRYSIRRNMTLAIISHQPALSLNFVLKSNINYQLDGFSKDTMLEQQFNLIYIPHARCEYVFREDEEYVFFGIQYIYSYLERWKTQFSLLKDFLNKAGNNAPAMMSSRHPALTPEMKAMVWEILQDMYIAPVRKIRLEVKALELLEAALEQISLNELGAGQLRLSDEDTEKIRKAREYLVQHLDSRITLKSLAREVGTNIFKLKTGFKRLYGATVFHFLWEERMQKARKLLLETHTPVHKIASAVGYHNPANFATSFKKRFGYPPSSLRS